MAPGCPEKLDWEFMKYIWRYKTVSEPPLIAALDRYEAWPRTVTLHSDAEAARYLNDVAKAG
jgi:hypothetical protein